MGPPVNKAADVQALPYLMPCELLFPGGERRGKDVTVDRMQAQHQHRTVKEMVS